MPVIFPPLHMASSEGLLAIGGELNYETLHTAYSQGIFPWPISDHAKHMTWFSPDPRGVLYTNHLHLSKSFKKFLKKSSFTIKFNTHFLDVIQNCATVQRPNEEGTWISKIIIDSFYEFYTKNCCYSVEVFQKQDLVGGLYGVIIGKYLTGESMFHTEPNASKVALTALIQRLKQFDIPFLDTQMVTPIIKDLGGSYIDRNLFIHQQSILCADQLTRDEIFPAELEWKPNQLLDF